ncbi:MULTISPECIES: hypothetical protein [unclassified Nocardioides]|uniref:hypothetical protein n=1 Tax=unclassified Nocardioides TaxID=2615069 RepID=UPI00360CDB42
MRALRWAAASLLMVLAGVLGLLGAVLCVTVVLLPIGIPLVFLARKLFRAAGGLVVPRPVRHPVAEAQDRAGKGVKKVRKASRHIPGRASRTTRVRRKLHLT